MELIVVVFLLATIEFKGNSNWIEGDDKRAADSFLFDCCKDMRNDPIKITRNQLKLSQCCPDFSVTSYFIFALQFRRYFYSEIQNFSVDSFTRLIGLWNGLIAVVLLRIIGFMEEFGKKYLLLDSRFTFMDHFYQCLWQPFQSGPFFKLVFVQLMVKIELKLLCWLPQWDGNSTFYHTNE